MQSVRPDNAGAPPPDQPGHRRGFRLGAAVLVALCLVVYLPGFFSLPPIDRDESRFAQASRQMLESRDPSGWIVPRVQDRARLNKPPLIYWLQAGAAGVLTAGRPEADAIWMYRVPSLIAAILAVVLTWRIGASMFDANTGRLGAALLAVCPVVAWEARQARADMVLLAVTTLAMLALWRVYERSAVSDQPGWRWPLTFWAAVGLGIMTKGPITPLVALLCVLSVCVLSGRWRWIVRLRPFTGVVVAFVIVAPWVIAVGREVGWDIYLNTISDEVFGRTLAPKEGHSGPPGYHTLLLAALFWPGSLLTALAIGRAVGGAWRRGTAHPATMFCVAWIVPAWIVFELVRTKLPHYTLPMYPAIAILSARAVLECEAGLVPWVRGRAARCGFLAWLLIGLGAIGLVFGLLLLSIVKRFHDGAGMIGTVLLIAFGVAALVVAVRNVTLARAHLRGGRILRGQLAGVLVSAVLLVVFTQFGAPPLVNISEDLTTLMRVNDREPPRPIAAVGYHEDSLVFLTRGRAKRIDAAELGVWLEGNPDGLVVLPKDDPRVPELNPLGYVIGFNYSRGRYEELLLVERRP